MEATDIRVYRDSDQDGVVALWNSVLPDSSPHNEPLRVINQKVAVDPELFLVAMDDGQVIGTVMGGYDGHRGWIYSLAVDTNHRYRGIATALMGQIEQKLRTLGCLK